MRASSWSTFGLSRFFFVWRYLEAPIANVHELFTELKNMKFKIWFLGIQNWGVSFWKMSNGTWYLHIFSLFHDNSDKSLRGCQRSPFRSRNECRIRLTQSRRKMAVIVGIMVKSAPSANYASGYQVWMNPTLSVSSQMLSFLRDIKIHDRQTSEMNKDPAQTIRLLPVWGKRVRSHLSNGYGPCSNELMVHSMVDESKITQYTPLILPIVGFLWFCTY